VTPEIVFTVSPGEVPQYTLYDVAPITGAHCRVIFPAPGPAVAVMAGAAGGTGSNVTDPA